MSYDTWIQLMQFWGYSTFTSHHPPVYALIVGFFTWMGKCIGNTNAGLYMFVIFQSIIYALVISYSFTLFKKLKAPLWLWTIYFITCAFTPYYADRVDLVIKDSLYSICVLLFIVELITALLDLDDFLGSRSHWILSFLSVMGVLLLRNNGKHILYPTFAVLIIALVKKSSEIEKIKMIQGITIIAVPVICAVLLEACVEAGYHVQPGSIAEMLSLPFQQTARTVAEHGTELTDEEKAAIDAVLKYDEIAENYKPQLSDPVKERMRRDVSNEDLKNYLLIWFKMFFKYPDTYVTATVNQSYGLVYLFRENGIVYMGLFNAPDYIMELLSGVGFEEVTGFAGQKETLLYWERSLYSFPVLGVLSHPALYVLALLITMIFAAVNKKYRYLIPAVPLFINVVVIVLAPAIQGHPRYAFPIIYSMPILVSYYIYINRDNERNPAIQNDK